MAIIDVIIDLAQICHDLLMGPTLEGSPQIDANDFAKYTGVDSFGIVRWKSLVDYSLGKRECLKEWAKTSLATEITEFFEKNSKVSVDFVASPRNWTLLGKI